MGASSLSPQPASKPIAATLVGTLRRKNPFSRAPINTTDFSISPSSMKEEPSSPVVPPKSTLRPTSHILQRNRVDPTDDDDDEIETTENRRSSSKSATVSAKRLSLRLPNAFRNSNKENDTINSKKFGFTLGANSRKQRKQLDLSLFQTEQQKSLQEEKAAAPTATTTTIKTDSGLVPPPTLSDGSTLSSSSSTCSSTHSSYSPVVSSKGNIPPTFKTVMNKQSNQNVFVAGTPRRSSQASFKSIDRRGSNISSSTLGQQQQQQQQQNRPTTPSLLSNSSTINSPTVSNIPSQPAKASWLNNLFFFKQPKVCSLVVYSTHTAGILRSLHRLMNTVGFTHSFLKVYTLYSSLFNFNRIQKHGSMRNVTVQVLHDIKQRLKLNQPMVR